MEIRIGTSGWHYKHWIGTYYEAKQPATMLARYVQDFDTVEINNSFYHLPSSSALKQWRASTPGNFRFAAKASRLLTHMKKLKDAEQALARYLSCMELLGNKLGPILFQLPPNWQVNAQRQPTFFSFCLPGTGMRLSSATTPGIPPKCLSCCGARMRRCAFITSRGTSPRLRSQLISAMSVCTGRKANIKVLTATKN